MLKFYSFLLAVFLITGCITVQVNNESAAQKDGGSISESEQQKEEVDPTIDIKADLEGI